MLKKILEINGDTLTIPELKNYQGKTVALTIEELPEDNKEEKGLEEYFGILKPKGDAMEFQKKMRAEWDDREKPF